MQVDAYNRELPHRSSQTGERLSGTGERLVPVKAAAGTNPLLRATSLLLTLALALTAAYGLGSHSSRRPPTVNPAGCAAAVYPSWSLSYNDIPPTPITDAATVADFDYALGAWSKALGRPIKRPSLRRGSDQACGVYGDPIACVTPKLEVILVRHGKQFDMRTIFLHEIGHVLGVPHISGDPLMDPVYGGTVDGPTLFAVAIAKAEDRSRVR